MTIPAAGITQLGFMTDFDTANRLVLFCQEETALRLTQLEPGAFDYRAANIETQLYSNAKCLFIVPKKDFMPIPDCNGMVVDFELYPPEQMAVADAKTFLAMVSYLDYITYNTYI